MNTPQPVEHSICQTSEMILSQVHVARRQSVQLQTLPPCMCHSDWTLCRQVDAVATEAALLDVFVDAVRALDPDILVGYDVRKVPVHQRILLFDLAAAQLILDTYWWRTRLLQNLSDLHCGDAPHMITSIEADVPYDGAAAASSRLLMHAAGLLWVPDRAGGDAGHQPAARPVPHPRGAAQPPCKMLTCHC